VNTTIHPALHRIQIPTSEATARSGTMWPSSKVGRPGIIKLQTCIDLTILPSGRLIVRGCVASQKFDMVVPFMTKTEVAPVSITACVHGILVIYGCILCAHTSCCLDLFIVTNVILLLSSTVVRLGYKVGV
jgi:hypothetical protein